MDKILHFETCIFFVKTYLSIFAILSSPESSYEDLYVRCNVDANGRRIEISTTNVSLNIPKGALNKECVVEMGILRDDGHLKKLQSFSSNTCAGVELVPKGLKLQAPAKLTVPHCLLLKEGSTPRTARVFESYREKGEQF